MGLESGLQYRVGPSGDLGWENFFLWTMAERPCLQLHGKIRVRIEKKGKRSHRGVVGTGLERGWEMSVF